MQIMRTFVFVISFCYNYKHVKKLHKAYYKFWRNRMENMEEKVQVYDVTALTSLEKLEPVRIRPGMYIGSTGIKGLHHCIWEVLDNAIDEISNGFGNKAAIILNKDKSCNSNR